MRRAIFFSFSGGKIRWIGELPARAGLDAVGQLRLIV